VRVLECVQEDISQPKKIIKKRTKKIMSNDQMKNQNNGNKSGAYTSTGFKPSKPQPKPISIWDVITGRK